MAVFSNLGGAQPLIGTVGNPAGSSASDGASIGLSLNQSGALSVDQVHGSYYNAAKRGNLFFCSTLIAGTIIPVNAVNMVSGCTLWNPSGSGKNIELIEIALGIDSATLVVNGLALGFQSGLTAAGGTLTAIAGKSTMIGAGQVPVGIFYSACTLVNAAVLAPLMGLGISVTATSGAVNLPVWNANGKVILPPGSSASLLDTVVAMTAGFISVTWAEWPI
jgi:hypothetical protein